MLGARRKGEEAAMAATPTVEELHHGRHQLLRHAAVPAFRVNCKRAEKAEATPVRCEVRANQFSFELSGENSGWIGLPSCVGKAGITHERCWIGNTQERAEGEANDSVSVWQISREQRPDADCKLRLRSGDVISPQGFSRLLMVAS